MKILFILHYLKITEIKRKGEEIGPLCEECANYLFNEIIVNYKDQKVN